MKKCVFSSVSLVVVAIIIDRNFPIIKNGVYYVFAAAVGFILPFVFIIGRGVKEEFEEQRIKKREDAEKKKSNLIKNKERNL